MTPSFLAWKDLVHFTDEQLAPLDIALVNLACAVGLPDSGKIDFARCSACLNDYASSVKAYTQRVLPQFPREPEKYKNSQAYFRVLCMITHLQRDLGIRYNPDKRDRDVPLDCADTFVHGTLFGNGGSCASLPVVYTAIGRRLGYPIKLVDAAHDGMGHLFCRWEDSTERFNIEATGRGLNSFSDEYYRAGPHAPPLEQQADCCFLQTKTPKQELAAFLAQRGFLYLEDRNYRHSLSAFIWAYDLHPGRKLFWNCLAATANDWHHQLEAKKPIGFPSGHIECRRRTPTILSRDVMGGILSLEATENILRDPVLERDWWNPMRNGLTPPGVPLQYHAVFTENGCDIRFNTAQI